MTKQEAYAELRKKLDEVNDKLQEARDFADENDLVMSHKDNKGEYYGSIEDLLTVTTLAEDEISDWSDSDEVDDAERGFDYGWLPSSLRC